MNNLFKSILTLTFGLTIGIVSAQNVRNTNTVKTTTTVNSNINYNANTEQSMEVRAPKKRVESTKQVDLTMPEKNRSDAKIWRKKGLEQRSKTITPATSSPMKTKANKPNIERKFGKYEAFDKRAKVANDKDWVRLNEIVTNKVNLPNESYAIIEKKQKELEQDLKNKRINKKEYDLLSQDLKYAEQDVKKIETWVGGKR